MKMFCEYTRIDIYTLDATQKQEEAITVRKTVENVSPGQT